MRSTWMSTCLIALWVLSLAADSFEELLMIQEPVESNGKRLLTCVTEDDSAALVLNLDLRSSPKLKDSTSNPLCFSTEPTFTKYINFTSERDYKSWTVLNTLQDPMGPVFDYRWEDLTEHSFRLEQQNDYYVGTFPPSGKLVFSVRGLGNIRVIRCDSHKSQMRTLCRRAIITACSNKTSEICSHCRQLAEETSSSKNDQQSNVCNKFNQLCINEYEWRTFILIWNTTEMTIQANGKSLFPEKDKIPYFTKHPHQIYIGSPNPGHVRAHLYNYLKTTTNDTKLYTKITNNGKPNLCIELPVSLCSNCSVKVNVVNNTGHNIFTIGTITGNTEPAPAPAELPTWRLETLKASLPHDLRNSITLEINALISESAIDARWAIDRVRKCPSVDALKTESSPFIPSNTWAPVSDSSTNRCQKLSYTEDSVVGDYKKNKISSNQQECLRGNLSAYCKYQRSKWASGTSLCDRSGCTCAPGFKGNDCQTECPDGFYGYDCRESCSLCEDGTCSKTNGSCPDDCAYHHLPPYCETIPSDPVNLSVTSQGKGIVTLKWNHRPYDCMQMSLFVVKVNFVKSKLQTDPSDKFPISENYTMRQNPDKCTSKMNLELPTATLYNFTVKAVNQNESSEAAIASFEVPASVNFKSGEAPEAKDHGTFIELKVPAVVNATKNTYIKVLVNGSLSCKILRVQGKSPKLPNNATAVWIPNTFNVHENETQNLTIPKGPNCSLSLNETDTIYIALEVDNSVVSTIGVLFQSTVEIPNGPVIENSNLWIIVLLILLICVILLFIGRRELWNTVNRIRRGNLAFYSEALLNFVKSPITRTSQQSSPLSSNTGLFGIVSSRDGVAWNRYSYAVDIEDFEDYVKDSIANGLLKSQFMMFPRGLNKPCTYGALPENKPKNRYANITAYDETRVILKKKPGDPHSDYINANYVQGFGKKNAYIAAQGPKPQSLIDFWRMIWQEEALIICMLTNVIEGQKVKCVQYWPEFGDSRTYDDIVIVTEKHNVFPDYTLRTFRVSCKRESRKIEHLHYTGWPDHSVPMYVNSVIAYLKKLQATPVGRGPIIVHCSAGVGRTGTVILGDICLRGAATKGNVDVLGEFKKLRDSRMNLVDNELQYLFVHLVILECLASQPTELPCNKDLPHAIEELKKKLPRHIERLRETAWQDQVLHPQISPRPPLPEQLAKNRFPELAPVSSGLVYLERYPTSDNNSDYISAITVDGTKIKKQYLASQLPMPSTLSDFWRLIADQRTELVIMLQQPDLDDPTCCAVIPGQEPLNPVPFLNVELKVSSEPENPPSFVELLLTDTSAGTPRTQRVTVLTCIDWGIGKGGKPPPPNELIELWTASENIHREKGSTLVLCHDGVTGCGLYLALSSLLERMAVERECDVIFAVRTIRRSRAEFVRSQEQFQYLYDAAAKYVESFETYANFR